jgi:hypothetical protein
VDRAGGGIVTTRALYDAMDGRAYGFYSEVKDSVLCMMTPTANQSQMECSSKAEFEAFVAKYMEE